MAQRTGPSTAATFVNAWSRPPGPHTSPSAASRGNGVPMTSGESSSPTPCGPGCRRTSPRRSAATPVLGTIMGYAAIYPEDVVSHHRAFIARRRAERPSEEYRDLTVGAWDEFLAHFELRKVALGVCGHDYGTPCAHENACVRCPILRVDPVQIPRLEEIHTNLGARLQEVREQAGSARSPRSKPPWPPPCRNWRQCAASRRALSHPQRLTGTGCGTAMNLDAALATRPDQSGPKFFPVIFGEQTG
jgi:hypothetical protein